MGEIHLPIIQQGDRAHSRPEPGMVNVHGDSLTREIFIHNHLLGLSVEQPGLVVQPPSQTSQPLGQRSDVHVRRDCPCPVVVTPTIVLNATTQVVAPLVRSSVDSFDAFHLFFGSEEGFDDAEAWNSWRQLLTLGGYSSVCGHVQAHGFPPSRE